MFIFLTIDNAVNNVGLQASHAENKAEEEDRNRPWRFLVQESFVWEVGNKKRRGAE